MAERVVKVRWKCAWCRRSFANGSYALRHERDCSHNPAVQGKRVIVIHPDGALDDILPNSVEHC